MAEQLDSFVVVQGMRVHFVQAGSGHPLVLIHGLTGSTTNWRRSMDALAERAAVYALDLINMGRSDRSSNVDPGLRATADRVLAWMDAVGIARADVAGHSHGGAVAMMLAARHPRRVRSLLLFAPANPYSCSVDWLVRLYSSRVGGLLARVAPHLPRQIQMIALGRMYADRSRIVPGALEGYVDGLHVPGTVPFVLKMVRTWFAEMHGLKAALPSLASVPVLLVWGDRDRAVSVESGLRLHSELPCSTWALIEHAGHIPFEELPDTCNRLMVKWLEGLDVPRVDPLSAAQLQSVAHGEGDEEVGQELPSTSVRLVP